MRKLHLLVPAVVLALAIALAACGGGESDEEKIVATIKASALNADPSTCETYATQKFLEQSQFSEGEEAVESCEEDAEETADNADAVKVSKVAVDGSDATADVAFTGGAFDGQTLSVALVEEDDEWKMDAILRFARFDQPKFAAALEQGLQEGKEPLEGGIASCIAEVIGGLPQDEVEEVVIAGNEEKLVELYEGCR